MTQHPNKQKKEHRSVPFFCCYIILNQYAGARLLRSMSLK